MKDEIEKIKADLNKEIEQLQIKINEAKCLANLKIKEVAEKHAKYKDKYEVYDVCGNATDGFVPRYIVNGSIMAEWELEELIARYSRA